MMVEAMEPMTVMMRHMVGKPTTALAAIDSIEPVGLVAIGVGRLLSVLVERALNLGLHLDIAGEEARDH